MDSEGTVMIKGLSLYFLAAFHRYKQNIGKEKNKDIRKDNGDPARQQTH